MHLRAFIESRPGKRKDVISDLADRLGISGVYLMQLCAEEGSKAKRDPAPQLAVSLERETAGAVRRWDSRPRDWWLIWPELVSEHGAPAVPTAGEKQADVSSADDRTENKPIAFGNRREKDLGRKARAS